MDPFALSNSRIMHSEFWTYPTRLTKMFCQWGLPGIYTTKGFPDKPLPPIVSAVNPVPIPIAQVPALRSSLIGTGMATAVQVATKRTAKGPTVPRPSLPLAEPACGLQTPKRHWSFFTTETCWEARLRVWACPLDNLQHLNNLRAGYMAGLPWLERICALLMERGNYADLKLQHDAVGKEIKLREQEVESFNGTTPTGSGWYDCILENQNFVYPHDAARYDEFLRLIQRNDNSDIHLLWVPHSADYFLDGKHLRALQEVLECRWSKHLRCVSDPHQQASLDFEFDDTIPPEFLEYIYILQLIFPGQLPLVLETLLHPEPGRCPAAYASFFPPWSWCERNLAEVRSILSARLTGRSNAAIIPPSLIKFYCENHGYVDMTTYFSMGQLLDGDDKAFSELEAVVRYHPVPFHACPELGRVLNHHVPGLDRSLVAGMFPPGSANPLQTMLLTPTSSPTTMPGTRLPVEMGAIQLANIERITHGTKRGRESDDEPRVVKRTKWDDDRATALPEKPMNLLTPPVTPPKTGDTKEAISLSGMKPADTVAHIGLPSVSANQFDNTSPTAAAPANQTEVNELSEDVNGTGVRASAAAAEEMARLRAHAFASGVARQKQEPPKIASGPSQVASRDTTGAEHPADSAPTAVDPFGLPVAQEGAEKESLRSQEPAGAPAGAKNPAGSAPIAVDLIGLPAEQEVVEKETLPSQEAASAPAGANNPAESAPTAVDPIGLPAEQEVVKMESLPSQEAASAPAGARNPAESAPIVVDPIGLPAKQMFLEQMDSNMADQHSANALPGQSGVQRTDKSRGERQNKKPYDHPSGNNHSTKGKAEQDVPRRSPPADRSNARGHAAKQSRILDEKRELDNQLDTHMGEDRRSRRPVNDIVPSNGRGFGGSQFNDDQKVRSGTSGKRVHQGAHNGSNSSPQATRRRDTRPTPDASSRQAGPSNSQGESRRSRRSQPNASHRVHQVDPSERPLSPNRGSKPYDRPEERRDNQSRDRNRGGRR